MLVVLLIFVILVILVVFLTIVLKFGDIPAKSNVCLNGKIAVVTGGSSGIGYQIAVKLASRGCRVIIADVITNEDIKKSIIEQTDNSDITLEYVDFGSFKSVRNFAEKLNKTLPKLDILINNVGIGRSNEPSEDGINLTMQINYYSAFLLTHLLVDSLKKSNNGRVIFTSSLTAYCHTLFPIFLSSTNIKMLPFRSSDYAITKFCCLVASNIFAKKLKKYNITSNTYHPGCVNTNIWAKTISNINNIVSTFLFLTLFYPLSYFGVTPDRGCQGAVELATSKEYENVTGVFLGTRYGKYFPNFMPRGINDLDFVNKIWKVSEHVVQLKPEERLD